MLMDQDVSIYYLFDIKYVLSTRGGVGQPNLSLCDNFIIKQLSVPLCSRTFIHLFSSEASDLHFLL